MKLPGSSSTILGRIRGNLERAVDTADLLRRAAAMIGAHFGCDRVYLQIDAPSLVTSSWGERLSSKNAGGSLVDLSAGKFSCAGAEIQGPLYVNDTGRTRGNEALLPALRALETYSFSLTPLLKERRAIGWIECHFRRSYHRWRREEVIILTQLADYILFFIEKLSLRTPSNARAKVAKNISVASSAVEQMYGDKLAEARREYERALEIGKLVLIRTNPRMRITEIRGDTEGVFGFTPEQILKDPDIWEQIFDATEHLRFKAKLRELIENPSDLNDELKVIRAGRPIVWVMLRGAPVYSEEGEFKGWEGFAVDISDRRRAQEELVAQNRRLNALFEVTRSLQVNSDPQRVLLKGLSSLLTATAADAGMAFYIDDQVGELELAAAQGFTQSELEGSSILLRADSLLKSAMTSGIGAIVDDVSNDDRVRGTFGLLSRFGSVLVTPLVIDGRARGALAIFASKTRAFGEDDQNLIAIAARQISLAARQAEYYANDRRQLDSLTALYRLSHELSKHTTPADLARHAFPVIREELGCKRMWLGIVNEPRTHIVGQAAYGPGIRRRLARVQIEMNLRHDFLDEAVQQRRAVIVRAGQTFECSGLNRMITRLNVGTFVIVPLISLGEVVGVMVVEPMNATAFFAQQHLPLLTSMAGEIANVLLARRFEVKMAEADKSKMAGVLAAGVAHNFNNLLQAVMGQASLIQMQLPTGSPLMSSARMIIEAATRGAALIGQLLSFSSREGAPKNKISVKELLVESRDFYKSILGSGVTLDVTLEEAIPDVIADAAQVQQVISNLLVNAREALGERNNGVVKIQARKVRLLSDEIATLPPGTYLRIDVEDNGEGMDEEGQARCFEPFFSTKKTAANSGMRYSASGLGLSSAFTIVKQHGGVITVKSSPGQGSVMSVFLPLFAQGERPQPAKAIANQSQGDRLDAIVIGVESGLTQSLCLAFESQSMGARLINTSERALELLHSAQGAAVELALIDVDTINSSVPDFVREVRVARPGARVVAIAADVRVWGRLLSPIPGIEVVETPFGVWAAHTLVRRLVDKRVLSAKVEVVHSADSDNGHKKISEDSAETRGEEVIFGGGDS